MTSAAIVTRPGLGIALRVLSVALFAVMNLCVRTATQEVPVGQMVFFRSVFALLPLVIYLWARGQFPGGLRTRKPGGHAARSLLGCSGMFLSFLAFQNLPLANATVLGFVSPLLTVLIAGLLLGEKPGLVVYGAIGAGFAGILVMLSPALQGPAMNGGMLLGTAAGLGAAVSACFAMAQLKKLTATEAPGAIALYFALVCSGAGLITVFWGWVWPSTTILLILIASGIIGGFAHIVMTEAYARAPASTLAPFEYTAMIWAVLLDGLVFSLWPQPVTLLGAVLVVGAAAVVALRR